MVEDRAATTNIYKQPQPRRGGVCAGGATVQRRHDSCQLRAHTPVQLEGALLQQRVVRLLPRQRRHALHAAVDQPLPAHQAKGQHRCEDELQDEGHGNAEAHVLVPGLRARDLGRSLSKPTAIGSPVARCAAKAPAPACHCLTAPPFPATHLREVVVAAGEHADLRERPEAGADHQQHSH